MTTTPSPTTAPGTVREREAIRGPPRPRARRADSATVLLNVALLGLCVIWMVPVIGLLITWVRNPDAPPGGWWTWFADPFHSPSGPCRTTEEVLLETAWAPPSSTASWSRSRRRSSRS